ncbi:MAG TPA: hypothetical protein VGZ00_09265 [Candidatus Baltobacteraceae bacterium]|jgi:hypothetical protein|nr:hypothetical protein [Candidatus Baltobacteraceae bacterium]
MSELIEVNGRELRTLAKEELSSNDQIKFDDTFNRNTQDLMFDEIEINQDKHSTIFKSELTADLSEGIVARSYLKVREEGEKQILKVTIFKPVFESVFVNPDKIFKAKWVPDDFGGHTAITFSVSGRHDIEVRETPVQINAAIKESQRRVPEL